MGYDMKKIIVLLLLFNFFIPGAVFANTIEASAAPVDIQTEMLKKHCSGYEIKILNNGKNPVKILKIDVKNSINNANQILVSEGLQAVKKNNKYFYLSILTLGVTSLVGTSKNNAALSHQKEALAEAATFETSATLENMKNEIIMPNREKTIKLLFPLNEGPAVEILLQDEKTKKHIETIIK